jgi:hypothetical protein
MEQFLPPKNLQFEICNLKFMNAPTEFLLIATVAILSGLAFCTLIGGVWLAIHRHHEADQPPPWPENRISPTWKR